MTSPRLVRVIHQRDRSATMIRRDFLKTALAAAGSSGLLAPRVWAFDVVSVENPLGAYPSRDWEQVYRDQYRYDSTFTWVCAPNDTHFCRMRAFRPQWDRLAQRAELRSRPVRRPVREQGDQGMEPPRLCQGFHHAAARLWPLSAQGTGTPQGLEGMGRRRVPLAVRQARAADEVSLR